MTKHYITREVSHEEHRAPTGADAALALATCGLSFVFGGTSGEVTGHTVTLEDQDGCRGKGTAETYEEARLNASRALRDAQSE